MVKGTAPKPSYEVMLCSVGRFLDRQGNIRDVNIVEFQEGIIVQGLQHESTRYHTSWVNKTWVFDHHEVSQL